ncbi:oligomeric, coiled-coil, peripheral membrane protein, partial [Serendipita sp. 397]
MQICRAEDGQVFQINTTLYDIAKKPSTLRTLLAECTSVDPGSMIMFLSDGQQLREDNIRELSDAQDQTIFVFNRDYLDLEVDEVMSVLGVREGDGLLPSGSLQEDSISSLRTSQVLQDQFQRSQQHQSYISALFQQIHSQHDALLIASANLDMHILTLSDAWMALRESISSNLETQAKLLDGIDYDLDTISQLSVHPSFLAVASAKSNAAPTTPIKEREGDGGIKAKTLGEYVSRVKMKLVVDSCRKMHVDLKNRYRQAQTSMDDLIKGSDEIRASIHNNGSLSDASLCTKRSMDDVERMGS